MSQGTACKCPQKRVPIERRRWGVIQRHARCSAFDGYQVRYSDYSAVVCLQCNAVWRTKAEFVGALPDVHTTGGAWEFVKPVHDVAPPKVIELSGVMVDGGDCCGMDVYREAPLRDHCAQCGAELPPPYKETLCDSCKRPWVKGKP